MNSFQSIQTLTLDLIRDIRVIPLICDPIPVIREFIRICEIRVIIDSICDLIRDSIRDLTRNPYQRNQRNPVLICDPFRAIRDLICDI